MMRTLKIKTSLVKTVDSLSDAELGRLFRGTLKYASFGTEPTLSGAERILWPEIKEDIDSQLYAFKKMCERNHKNITARYDSIRLDTTGNDSLRLVEREKEESGEGKEPKEKLSPLNPLVKEKQEKQEGKGERETPLSQVPPHAKKPRKFIPPTLDEVRAYCRQRNSSVDPVQFYDYFTADPSRAWIDAKGQPVQNWKQKIVTWEKFNVMPKKSKPVDDGRATNNIFLQLLDEMEAQQNGQK